MGHGSVNNNNSFALGNAANRPIGGTGDKLSPPDGRTLVRIDVRSSVQPDKNGKVIIPDADIERAVFAHFGLKSESKEDLQKLKDILRTTENPFQYVKTTLGERRDYRADHVYRVPLSIQNSLLAKLSGTATEVKRQIREEKLRQTSANPNETVAGRTGYDAARQQQAKLNRLIREAQVLPSSFGIPSKLTDLTHVALTLPAGSAPTADNALSAYIEKRFGGGNLFGENKIAIQNAAGQSGVQIENFKVSPNNNRVVEFDLNLESVLKLQKAYLDVQEKVNQDIAVADDVRDKMALNQFLLGVMDGAIEDVKGNYNAIRHPLETLQGIRDAVSILSQLTSEDIKNIAAELGSKAVNATPGEAAYGAGYVVGTVVVEAVLAKGAGAALSALGKTKAGAEFLARIGKIAERTGELANLGKAKIAEMFSDEAAALAKQGAKSRLRQLASQMNSGLPFDPLLVRDLSIVAGNKLKNGTIKFREFAQQMVDEFGGLVKPQLEKLYRDAMEKLGKVVDKNEIQSLNLNEIKIDTGAITSPPKARRNARLVGDNHPVTDVPYDRNSYPIFSSKRDVTLPKNLRGGSVSDAEQFKYATGQLRQTLEKYPNLKSGFTKEQLKDIEAGRPYIDGLTWHHHQDGIRLQLVDRDIHAKTGHDGGRKNTGGRP